MNAGRASEALFTRTGCHRVPGRWWALSQECVGARSTLVQERCSQVNPGQGAVMGRPSGIQPHLPATLVPGRPGRPQGLVQTFSAARGWLPALPCTSGPPTRSLPSSAPVPGHAGCPWLQPGWQVGARAQPASALATDECFSSALMALFLPCSELVPGDLPIILLLRSLPGKLIGDPRPPCHHALVPAVFQRAGILPL